MIPITTPEASCVDSLPSEISSRLSDAIRQVDDTVRAEKAFEICKATLLLTGMAKWSGVYPELFPFNIVRRCIKLLQKGAVATEGSRYELNCAGRAKEFSRTVKSGKSAHATTANIP